MACQQKVLSLAIAHWPSEIEDISFCLSLQDYAPRDYSDILDMVKIHKDGSIDLRDGYLPSKTRMDRFIQDVQKSRPQLRKFDLTMHVTDSGRPIKEKLFEYKYTTKAEAQSGKTMVGSLHIQVDQKAIEALCQSDVTEDEDSSESNDSEDYADSEEIEQLALVALTTQANLLMMMSLTMMMRARSATTTALAASLLFDDEDLGLHMLRRRRDLRRRAMLTSRQAAAAVQLISDSGSDSDEED